MRYIPQQSLGVGNHDLYAEMHTDGGNFGWSVRYFDVDIERSYLLELASPADGSVVLESTATIEVRSNSTSGAPRDIKLAGANPNSRRYEEGNFVYSWHVDLVAGDNPIEVHAEFANGVTRVITFQLTHLPTPTVSILSPADWSILGPLQPVANKVSGDSPNLTGMVQG
jgi:hypothetical protein